MKPVCVRRDGLDIHCKVPINLAQALLSSKIRVRTVHGKRVALRIPPGTQPGQKFRIRGQGIEWRGETGYPCLPAERIVGNTPLPPDTLTFFYGSDLLVDSLYHSDAPLAGPRRGGGHGMTRIWYGAHARVDSIHDSEGHRRWYQYESTWDNLNVAISDTTILDCDPSCSTAVDTVMFGHDAVTGRVVWTRRGAAGRKVTVFRDLIGRDTMVIDSAEGGGSAITTKTRINETARTVTVIDGNGAEFGSLLDARGRVIRATDPAGARDTFAYDANDRVTSWTTRRDQTITYAYDALGRLDEKVVPGTGGGTWTYGYHATLGTLDTLLSPAASVYRVHNQFGWLTEEKTVVNGVTRTVEYGHTPQGVLDSLTDPWSGVYTFGWDSEDRARTVTNPFFESFGIRYDEEGLMTQVDFPTGTDNFTYDRSHRVQTAGLSGEIAYARDSITKGLSEITWGGVTQVFGYDGYGRLAKDSVSTTGYGPVVETFTYDAAGNRTGNPAGYTYTATNAARKRPAITGDTFAPGDSLWYDAAGNPVRWKNLSTGANDSLFWDAENRLIRFKRRSSGGALQLDIQYAYDGFGRRIRQSGTGVDDRLYVWNGWELLGETDLSGNATRRYTHHPEGLDFPLAMHEGSTTHFLHRDGQGNVYTVTNTSGTRRSLYTYLAWGDRYNSSTENVESPFTYKGREEDRETGLVYMRYRYYSPRLERFLNEDPIGIAGGLNLYGFAAGSPVNFGDPFGLSTCYTWFCPLDPIIIRDNALGAIQNWTGSVWIGDQFDAWGGSNFFPGGGAGLDSWGAGGGGSGGTSWGPAEGNQDTGQAGGEDGTQSCGVAVANFLSSAANSLLVIMGGVGVWAARRLIAKAAFHHGMMITGRRYAAAAAASRAAGQAGRYVELAGYAFGVETLAQIGGVGDVATIHGVNLLQTPFISFWHTAPGLASCL